MAEIFFCKFSKLLLDLTSDLIPILVNFPLARLSFWVITKSQSELCESRKKAMGANFKKCVTVGRLCDNGGE